MKVRKSILLNILLLIIIIGYMFYKSLIYYFENHYQCNEEGYLIKNGKSIIYYPNGIIEEEGEIKDCHISGVYKIYYDNGQLKSIGLKRNGENIGIWQTFDLEGKLMYAIYYNKLTYYNIPLDSFPDLSPSF